MKWPSWQDLSKAFNACKREDYTFATERYQTRGLHVRNRSIKTHRRGRSIKTHRRGRIPRFRHEHQELARSQAQGWPTKIPQETSHRVRFLQSISWSCNDQVQRKATHPTTRVRFGKTQPHTSQGNNLRGTHQVPQRAMDSVDQLLGKADPSSQPRRTYPERSSRYGYQSPRHRQRRTNVGKPKGLLPSQTKTCSLATSPSSTNNPIKRLVGSPT